MEKSLFIWFILFLGSINFLSAGKRNDLFSRELLIQDSPSDMQEDSGSKKRKYDDAFEQKTVLSFRQEPQEEPVFKQQKESFPEYYISDSHLKKCLREYGFDLEKKWDDIVELHLPFPGSNNQEFNNLFTLRKFNQIFLDALEQLSREITLFFNNLASKPEEEILLFITKLFGNKLSNQLCNKHSCIDVELMNIQYLPDEGQYDYEVDMQCQLDDLPIKKWVEIYKLHTNLLTPIRILRVIDLLLVENFSPKTLAMRLAHGDQTFYSSPLSGMKFSVTSPERSGCQSNHMIYAAALDRELFELESINDLAVQHLLAEECGLDSEEELPSLGKKLAYFLVSSLLIAPALSWIPDLFSMNTTHQPDIAIPQEPVVKTSQSQEPPISQRSYITNTEHQQLSAQFRKIIARSIPQENQQKMMESDFCYSLTPNQKACCRIDVSSNSVTCCTVAPKMHQPRACSSFILTDDSSVFSGCNTNALGVVSCDQKQSLQSSSAMQSGCKIPEDWVPQRNCEQSLMSSKYDFFKSIFKGFFHDSGPCSIINRVTTQTGSLLQKAVAYGNKLIGRVEPCPERTGFQEITDACLSQDSCFIANDCMKVRLAQSVEQKMLAVNSFLQSKTPTQDHSVCFVTLSTPNRESFAKSVENNQVAYAQRHGYDYFKSDKALCPDRPEEWSKIVALSQAMDQSASEWLLWIDDDIVITNPSISLGSLIEKYGHEKNIIIAHDAYKDRGVPINNGIFLIRNCPWSKSFLETVWKKGREWGLLRRGKSLLEQETMTRLRAQNMDIMNKMIVIEQREMNSFLRCDHYDDPIGSKWQPGDFVAHATGMSEPDRKKVISGLISQGEFPARKPDMPC